MSSQDPYDDDEPHYLDLGKWLRIAVTAASGLALLALLFFAATDQGPSSLPDRPANPTAPPATLDTGAVETDNPNSPTPTPTLAATPTATATAISPATRAARGTVTPTEQVPVQQMLQTAMCSRLSCNDFYSRTELDSYLLQCPDDYGKFDRDGDGRTCYDADDW